MRSLSSLPMIVHTNVDRSKSRNVADLHPDRLAQLVGLWFSEAGVNQAFRLDDRGPDVTAERRSVTTTPAVRRGPSSAEFCAVWPSMSAVTRTSTSNAKPSRCSPGSSGLHTIHRAESTKCSTNVPGPPLRPDGRQQVGRAAAANQPIASKLVVQQTDPAVHQTAEHLLRQR